MSSVRRSSPGPGEPREQQPLRFSWEQAIRKAPDVTGNLLLTLLTVATYADLDGASIRVSEPTLAAATGLGVSTVRRHLTEARKRGLLRQVSRGHRVGSGEARASEHVLALPSQPLARERMCGPSTAQPRAVEPTSTAHQRAEEAVSTAQSEHLNRPVDLSQPLTGERLPTQTTKTTLSAHEEAKAVTVLAEESRERKVASAEDESGNPFGRPDFSPGACESAIRKAVELGVPQTEVNDLARAIGADETTTSPARLAT